MGSDGLGIGGGGVVSKKDISIFSFIFSCKRKPKVRIGQNKKLSLKNKIRTKGEGEMKLIHPEK